MAELRSLKIGGAAPEFMGGNTTAYVLMKLLESAPERYDRWIRILTLGRLDKAYDWLTSHIGEEDRVLDLGCGTGALTLRAARRGARVRCVDLNPDMLEIAGNKVAREGLKDKVEIEEAGVVELEDEPGSYDAVMCGLLLSELDENEVDYVLRKAWKLLRPGGLLLVADEVVPRNPLKRLVKAVIRALLLALTFIATQRASRPLKDLPERIERAGFIVEELRLTWLEDFATIVARKPGG